MVPPIKTKKGNAALAWLVALVIIFVLGVVYVSVGEPWQMVYNDFYPRLNSTYQPTAQRISSVWKLWPILMIFGVILFAFVMSAKGGTGGYGGSGYY